MKTVVLYFHGKGGSAAEAVHYTSFFPGCKVTGVDYTSETPWDAAIEFPPLFDRLTDGADRVILIANSIGAYFSLTALKGKPIAHTFLISPVIRMNKLITDMMGWAGVTEERLRAEQEIATPFGETLSWRYLCWVREHPVCWNTPADILCGEKDHLIPLSTMTAAAQ